MGLADIRDEVLEDQGVSYQPCIVDRLRGTLSEDDLAVFLTLLYDESLIPARLSTRLRERGVPVSGGTIRRHRIGECSRCKSRG